MFATSFKVLFSLLRPLNVIFPFLTFKKKYISWSPVKQIDFFLLTFANLYIKLWGLEMNLNTKVHHKTVFSKWCVLKISPLKMIFSCETMHFWITFSIVIFSNHSLEVRLWQLPLVRLPFYHGPQIENTQTCLLNWSDIHVELFFSFFFFLVFFPGFSGGFSGVVIAVLQLRLSGFHFKCPVSKARSSYPVSSALHFKKRGRKKRRMKFCVP